MRIRNRDKVINELIKSKIDFFEFELNFKTLFVHSSF